MTLFNPIPFIPFPLISGSTLLAINIFNRKEGFDLYSIMKYNSSHL